MASLAHLITPEHIKAAHDNGGRVTKIIDKQHTIKVGTQINRAQYDLLCDVYASGAIPCPKPIQFIEMGNGVNAVVMSTIDGLDLGKGIRKWKMKDQDLKALCEELVRGMDGVHRWMVKHRPYDGRGIHSVAQGGPITFPMFGDFLPYPVPIEAWVDVNSDQFPQPTDELAALQRQVLAELAEGDIIFCHMDIHGLNIMVKDGRLAALLDWDHAGWYTRNMDAFWMAYAGAVPGNAFVRWLMEAWGLSDSPIPDMAFDEGYELNKGYMDELARRQGMALRLAVVGGGKLEFIHQTGEPTDMRTRKDVGTLV